MIASETVMTIQLVNGGHLIACQNCAICRQHVGLWQILAPLTGKETAAPLLEQVARSFYKIKPPSFIILGQQLLQDQTYTEFLWLEVPIWRRPTSPMPRLLI